VDGIQVSTTGTAGLNVYTYKNADVTLNGNLYCLGYDEEIYDYDESTKTDLSLNSTIRKEGSIFCRNLTTNEILYINGNIVANGNIITSSFLGSLPQLLSSLQTTSSTSISNDITYQGNITINKNLDVAGSIIGNITMNKNLDVAGSITAGTFNATSDYRLKTNIISLKHKTIDDLKPIEYQFRDKALRDFGFLAHELQEIYPELVTGEKDGKEIQTINYLGLIPILVKEIQELKEKVKILEKVNNV
jgi:cytoskeletal protein CcmA (bactofilin family)